MHDYENPKRIALSRRYPAFRRPIIFTRRLIRNIQNALNPRLRCQKSLRLFDYVVARHQSPLRRKLGSSDPKLQEQKIVNLKLAIKRLNGIVIPPDHIFSLWNVIGKPKYKDGYVDGMLLSSGKVVAGLGGGLCQLSNFLYWIFLHAPIATVERHHHSMDVFPDSGRTLPFGGGATILYNFIDLKIKNISGQPLQLNIWLTDQYLKGQILSPLQIPQKFHVFEKNHFFIKRGKKYFRYNEIHRETKVGGKATNTEQITSNFAPVLYKITDEYLKSNHFKVLDFSAP